MLKSFLLFTAVVLLVLASASAPAWSQASSQATAGKHPGPEAMAKAKKLYELDCALCHGSAGDGKTDLAKDMQLTMIDWTDPKSLGPLSDDALFEAIRKGKGKMPPEDEGRAKNDDIHNLVVYIRRFAKEGFAPAPAASQPAATPAPDAAPAPAPPTAPSH